MTNQKQPHEGEIWRKQGPVDWCQIVQNKTPEASNYDGGLSGFGMRYGNFSFMRKRVYWLSITYFLVAPDYTEFVVQMEYERRYLMHGKAKEQKNEL